MTGDSRIPQPPGGNSAKVPVKLVRAELTRKTGLAPGVHRLVLHAPPVAENAEPGNFVHIAVGRGFNPLWRRAYSVCDTEPSRGEFSILVKVVGRGSAVLARSEPGTVLDILGPLGNSFTMPQPAARILLVSGGIGIPPLHFLLRRIARSRKAKRGRPDIMVLLGARTASEVFLLDELRDLGAAAGVSTDDGSMGFAGTVTQLLEKHLSETPGDSGGLQVYACGPESMLAAVARICQDHSLRCEAALEARMPCGIGACMGCVVRVQGCRGTVYERVCREGPVFDIRRVVWESRRS